MSTAVFALFGILCLSIQCVFGLWQGAFWVKGESQLACRSGVLGHIVTAYAWPEDRLVGVGEGQALHVTRQIWTAALKQHKLPRSGRGSMM